jgi:hypothetical protein
MKRIISLLFPIFLIYGLYGCSTGLENANIGKKQGNTINSGSNNKTGTRQSRTIRSGPTDIHALSDILERAGHPLTESQINYLLNLSTGAEFTQKMGEVLDDDQINDVNNSSKGKGGRRR